MFNEWYALASLQGQGQPEGQGQGQGQGQRQGQSQSQSQGLVRPLTSRASELSWMLVDTFDPELRRLYASQSSGQREQRRRSFQRDGIDHVDLRTDQDIIEPLLRLFRRKERRQRDKTVWMPLSTITLTHYGEGRVPIMTTWWRRR